MAKTLITTLEILSSWSYKNALDNSTPEDKGSITYDKGFTHGDGDNEVDEMWHDIRFVTPSTLTDDIDLAGVLTNVFGETITFAAVKEVFIHNLGVPQNGQSGSSFTPTAGEDLLVGGAGAGGNAWGAPFNGDQDAKLVVPSGGAVILTNPLSGFAVTAGTDDILRVVNDGTDDIGYVIVIKGVKA